MLCTRRTKTLVSTCVILSGMTNIVCLLYVGWITNYVANSGAKVAESGGDADRKLEEESKGETLKIIERLERLESVVNEHIKGQPSLKSWILFLFIGFVKCKDLPLVSSSEKKQLLFFFPLMF